MAKTKNKEQSPWKEKQRDFLIKAANLARDRAEKGNDIYLWEKAAKRYRLIQEEDHVLFCLKQMEFQERNRDLKELGHQWFPFSSMRAYKELGLIEQFERLCKEWADILVTNGGWFEAAKHYEEIGLNELALKFYKKATYRFYGLIPYGSSRFADQRAIAFEKIGKLDKAIYVWKGLLKKLGDGDSVLTASLAAEVCEHIDRLTKLIERKECD